VRQELINRICSATATEKVAYLGRIKILTQRPRIPVLSMAARELKSDPSMSKRKG
jgi:hypothetical protein